jgi:hypothetical protein
MAVLNTYTQVGQKRDVHETIFQIAPEDTPFYSSIGDGKAATAKKIEWQEDAPKARGANAKVEGADFPAANFDPTVMRENVCQIMSDTCKITGTADAISLYGRSDEFKREMRRTMIKVKGDLEYALISAAQNAAAGAADTARTLGNLFGNDSAGTAMVHSSLKFANSGTPRALTEALLLTAMEALYNSGGDSDITMIAPAHAIVVANFAYKTETSGAGDTASKEAVRSRDIGQSTTIQNVVTGYKGPHGETRFVQNRWLKSGEAVVYAPKNMAVRWLRPWKSSELPSSADAKIWGIVGEMTFQHNHYKSTALLRDLS